MQYLISGTVTAHSKTDILNGFYVIRNNNQKMNKIQQQVMIFQAIGFYSSPYTFLKLNKIHELIRHRIFLLQKRAKN